MDQDISILFEDFNFVETPPLIQPPYNPTNPTHPHGG